VPKTKTKTTTRSKQPAPLYRLRRSTVHGSGLFAARKIAKGEEIIEYLGQRISHKEADRRHATKADDDNHTFLFTIDAKTVVDAGVDGNDARFINHSCEPNCEVVIDDGRLLVESIRTIQPGEELAYDYYLTRAPDDSLDIEKIFACRCGAATCRGTMLAPRKKPKTAAAKAKAKAKAQPKAKARANKTAGRKRVAA
jgi:SET domain-containing protein